MKIATVLIIDYAAKSVTLDGREVAPAESILLPIDIDVEHGWAKVHLRIHADNVLVRTESGQESRPVASAEARRVVRHGLRDVLEWLGEPVSEEEA